jgi:hypothetical protein
MFTKLDQVTMKTKVGALRLKLNHSEIPGESGSRRLSAATSEFGLNDCTDSHLATKLAAGAWPVGKVEPPILAAAISAHTLSALVQTEMLDPGSATEKLQVYENDLGQKPSSGRCILQFLFADEGKVAMAACRLNSHTQLHVWDMAHRIPPPKSFYKAHPEILEVCKLCGTVVLDAATPSTLTTGSVNPLAGNFLAHWIQSALEAEETRPRFFFHVLVPARHWDSLIRIHFGTENGI